MCIRDSGGDVLLIAIGRGGIHGVQILALLVTHTGKNAGDGRTVHMHIEYAEKDADALARPFRSFDPCDFGYNSIPRRDNQAWFGGNRPLGIAEEPEKKRRQHDRNKSQPETAGQPKNGHCQRQKNQTVDVTVTNHSPRRLYGSQPTVCCAPSTPLACLLYTSRCV